MHSKKLHICVHYCHLLPFIVFFRLSFYYLSLSLLILFPLSTLHDYRITRNTWNTQNFYYLSDWPSMRPPTPRLRVNSEDVDLTCGPPYLSKFQSQDSSQHYQQTITLHPAIPMTSGQPPLSISPAAFPIVEDSIIAALVANSDPSDISVL